jgi:predicted nucleotidyltransferase component of viral defense system
MNSDALKARIKKIAHDKEVDPRALMQVYFMDQFLLRLSLYEEKEHIIIKGGMLMIALLGISTRSTIDIDMTIKKYTLTSETAMKLFDDIVAIPYEDGCTFEFDRITEIMDEKDYKGYRIYFVGKKEKITQPLHLDLSTGDKITPKEIDLTYKTFLLEEEVNIKSYNIETVVAEKLETILTRGIANTRMKDFYDIYIIHKMLAFQIDSITLKLALKNTLSYRETEFIMDLKDDVLEELSSDKQMKKLWSQYCEKYSFAKNIQYDACIASIKLLLTLAL